MSEPMAREPGTAPEPTRRRWQPMRLGLVDLFHYDSEELHFRDGRLLLRGNNGTGKSKVMALTLPFLLDGVLTPARLEPDGDIHKRMEWNLLLGGRYSERQGYTWMELGRLGENGPEHLTLGCGLKAVRGRPVQSWFFTTSRRIGRDLFLVERQRTLSRERLIETLEGAGRVYDRASDYRRALDEKLFHLGEERYQALLDLLIQLRQPQLSKQPHPERLSRALSDALPPLEQALLADVADAFRSLDAERDELRGLEEAAGAVEVFLEHYREYARVAAARRSAELRRTHSRYEETRGELGRDRDERARAEDDRARMDHRLADLRQELDAAREEERALRESPAMRSAEALKEAEDAARERRTLAAERAAMCAQTQAKLESTGAALAEQETVLAREAGELGTLLEKLSHHARHALIETALERRLAELDLREAETVRAEEANRRLAELEDRQRRSLTHLEALLASLASVESRERDAQRDWLQAAKETDLREAARTEAERRTAEQADALVGAWEGHLHGLKVLEIEDPEAAREELRSWAQTLAGPNPVDRALSVARDAYASRTEERRARLEQEREDMLARRDALWAEREHLEAGGETGPPPPHTRPEGVRDGRPGAPFWKLVEFHDDVSGASRAGLEAALEAAGLLDAWVMPDGSLLAPETWDALLQPEAPVESSLASVLRPAPSEEPTDAVRTGGASGVPVDRDVVGALLASIGFGEAPGRAWVSTDGRWSLGPVRGRWGKAEAVYLGHAARETARRNRLADLAEEIAAADASGARLERGLDALAEERRAAQREWEGRPSDQPLRDAHAEETLRASALREQRERLQTCQAALDEARERLAAAREERDRTASDLRLPADPTGLRAVREGLEGYRAELRALPPTVRAHRSARRRHDELSADRAACRELLEHQRGEQERSEREARAAEVRHSTLRRELGEEVETLRARLRAAAERITTFERRMDVLFEERRHLDAAVARLEEKIQTAETRLAEQAATRETAIEALRSFAAVGLLYVAAPDLEPPDLHPPWAPEPAVRLARGLHGSLTGVDASQAAWERQQNGLYQNVTVLTSALSRHGHEAHAELTGDLLLVRILFQSRECPPDELAERLGDEIGERRALLDSRERELLENYLIDEVASHLQQTIVRVERQTAAMNAEMERRPTSTGMKLRMRWQPLADGESAGGFTAPAGLRTARARLLRQAAAAWSAEDRAAVGAFLQTRIRAVREDEEGGGWVEVLERALDYRRWHRFMVERWQEGTWRPAYGPASGGERALVVTLPLFAAAAAHYGGAHPDAPRLVMLDEVFAGIDDDARAKCMGLLAQFDLDVLMTSEREWGCYAEVPGLAIAQLVRRDGIDAVYVSRWSWDGRRRSAAPAPERRLEAPGARRESTAGDTGSLL